MSNWIGPVVKTMKKGALTAQAKAAGMSITEFCAQPNLSTTTKKRCSLAKTLKSFHKK